MYILAITETNRNFPFVAVSFHVTQFLGSRFQFLIHLNLVRFKFVQVAFQLLELLVERCKNVHVHNRNTNNNWATYFRIRAWFCPIRRSLLLSSLRDLWSRFRFPFVPLVSISTNLRRRWCPSVISKSPFCTCRCRCKMRSLVNLLGQ